VKGVIELLNERLNNICHGRNINIAAGVGDVAVFINNELTGIGREGVCILNVIIVVGVGAWVKEHGHSQAHGVGKGGQLFFIFWTNNRA